MHNVLITLHSDTHAELLASSFRPILVLHITYLNRALKYVSKYRRERIAAIAEQLAASNYDIVGLQELWVSADYQLIQNKVSKQLPFSKLFHRCAKLFHILHVLIILDSGALGAGLAIFSKYPIIATSIHPYSLNGSPLDVTGGDWFVGKSAASIVIEHPILGEVEVFDTHVSLLQQWKEYNIVILTIPGTV